MTEPVWHWPRAYGSVLFHFARGVVLYPIHSLLAMPAATWFVLTGRWEPAFAEIQLALHQCWPRWVDRPDHWTDGIETFIEEIDD